MTIMRWLAALGVAMVPALALAAGTVFDAHEPLKLRPIRFLAVQGEPDACGPGCAKWIAAQGDFDAKAADRFREFLKSLPNSHLPVFFNSRGGQLGSALVIGEMLRKNGMAAGVGRTVSVPARAGHERRHRLEFQKAICASACAYAFIGATSREVAPAARLGVHSLRIAGSSEPVPGRIDKFNNGLRVYVVTKGVDAALIDLAAKMPTTRIYWLTYSEMVRYGIVSKDSFETPWRLLNNDRRYWLIKSLTRGAGAARHTTVVEFACQSDGDAKISIGRELVGREIGSRSIVRLKSGDRAAGDAAAPLPELAAVHASEGRYDRRETSLTGDALLKLASAKVLTLEEFFGKAGEQDWSRRATLSSEGLRDAVAQMLAGCGIAPMKPRSSASVLHQRDAVADADRTRSADEGGVSLVPRQRP